MSWFSYKTVQGAVEDASGENLIEIAYLFHNDLAMFSRIYSFFERLNIIEQSLSRLKPY